MIRALVLGDTHLEKFSIPERLLHMLESADVVIHTGDFESYEVYKKFAEYELIAVAGDSDEGKIREELPEERIFNLGNLKFGLIHKGNFMNEFHDVGYKAMELGVEFMIFGHIHRFVLEDAKGIKLLSPGSPTSPRLSIGSFVEMIVDGKRVDLRLHTTNKVCGIDFLKEMGCIE